MDWTQDDPTLRDIQLDPRATAYDPLNPRSPAPIRSGRNTSGTSPSPRSSRTRGIRTKSWRRCCTRRRA